MKNILYWQRYFTKKGYIVSYTNNKSKVLICINKKLKKSLNFNIETETIKEFKYHSNKKIKYYRPTPMKFNQQKIKKQGFNLSVLIPNVLKRLFFLKIIRAFRIKLSRNGKYTFVSRCKMVKILHALKAFKYLKYEDRNIIVSAYTKKDYIDELIDIFEKHSKLIKMELDCKCYLIYGRKYMCYRYFTDSLKFLLASKRIFHHMISINKVYYYPLDILLTINPNNKAIHNILRYKIAKAISEYVSTLDTEVVSVCL